MKKWLSRLLILAIVVGLVAAGNIFGPRLLYVYHEWRADVNLRSGQTQTAIDHMVPMFNMRPDNADLGMKLADAYISVNNYARAEYVLAHGISAQAGHIELYQKLCGVYLKQNKLWDAVDFLDELPNPLVKEQLDALRPKAPAPVPPPGIYDQRLTLTLDVPADAACYLSLDGEVPSMTDALYTGPIDLPAGLTELRAVIVQNDLASAWTLGTYKLENILQPVTFADPALEDVIRKEIGKPVDPVISDELWKIDTLELPDPTDYVSLADLVNLTGLTKLTLVGNGAHVDIAPLATLTKLKSLTLRNFALDSLDLDILAQWEWIESLDLQTNRIASLTPMSSMTGLKNLSLRANSIADITPLSELEDLVTLDIAQNALEDTAPLAKMAGLTEFIAFENLLTDLRGLQKLSNLKTVDISHNHVTDLSPLADHKALTTLLCEANPVETLEPLAGCTALETLLCTGGSIPSTAPLSDMTALRALTLSGNALTTLSGLGSCKALETLDVNKNAIASVEPLAGLPKLKDLRVEHNEVKSLAGLKSCPELRTIYAYENPLSDSSSVFDGTKITLYKGNA